MRPHAQLTTGALVLYLGVSLMRLSSSLVAIPSDVCCLSGDLTRTTRNAMPKLIITTLATIRDAGPALMEDRDVIPEPR